MTDKKKRPRNDPENPNSSAYKDHHHDFRDKTLPYSHKVVRNCACGKSVKGARD